MNPIAWLKLIVGALLACLLFFGGRSCGASAGASDRADLQRINAAQARALRASARSFDAFAGTFRAIDAHTSAQVAEAQRREGLAHDAAVISAAIEASATQRAQALARQLVQVKARSATCRVVMEADLDVCGVTLQ